MLVNITGTSKQLDSVSPNLFKKEKKTSQSETLLPQIFAGYKIFITAKLQTPVKMGFNTDMLPDS